MITALKIIFLLVLFLLFAYPLLPLPTRLRRFSTFYALKYDTPFNKRNFAFIPLTLAGFVAVVLLFELLTGLGDMLGGLPFVTSIADGIHDLIGDRGEFYLLTLQVLVVNLAILYAFVILKSLLRHCLLDPLLGWGKRGKLTREQRLARREAARRRRKEKKALRRQRKEEKRRGRKNKRRRGAPESEPEVDPEVVDDGTDEDNAHVMRFPHPGDVDPDDAETAPADEPEPEAPALPEPPKSAFMRWLLGLFFREPDYIYARPSVARAASVLQGFVYTVEVLYLILFIAMAAAVLFPMPDPVYALVIKFRKIYFYPFISIIFLQEICNFLHTRMPVPEVPERQTAQPPDIDEKLADARLLELLGELQKRFDAEHFFRYYPALPGEELPEFSFSNRPYSGALEYIRSYERQTSGHVVQSYMECLNAAYNDNHIYFGTSFYSEFGEYLSAYTYTRLLSGARMIFITSRRENVEPLRKYVRDRMTRLTNSRDTATWRVYISSERLDQADILIATPEDFRDDTLVRHYPVFFEEVCNAVFVDADRVTSVYGYLCPVISLRLQKVTEDHIRFIFLTRDVLRGFASRTLLRYFCIDKVYTCSNALENESTSYMLVNRESKSRRVYNRHRQSLTELECMIAQQALHFGIDGVKILTEAPVAHADREYLLSQHVEINEFYKPIPLVNYLIYSDENCNLASAIYTCTRFRGQQRSVANIISKPYLLRDYFVFMASRGDYINRSSFIQPRAVGSISVNKLTLLRIFCEASINEGLSLPEFRSRMKMAVEATDGRDLPEPCRKLWERSHTLGAPEPSEVEYAEYLVSGLLDEPDTPADRSAALRAKDYYIITDPRYNAAAVRRDKYICFKRSSELLAQLTARDVRVELRLNGQTVGHLDTTPGLARTQYMVGQSLTYKNVEYEIEQISDSFDVIFLRNENVTFRNSLDTVFLRRYAVRDMRYVGDEGRLYDSGSDAQLETITVRRANASVYGESYGFLTLTSDRQTLDLRNGVEGNPSIGEQQRKKYARDIKNGHCLEVTLRSRDVVCTDEMRLLISVVFNEFIKTLFPQAYRMLAVCPVLEHPVTEAWGERNAVIEQIRSLYPYLTELEYASGEVSDEVSGEANGPIETDDHRIRLLLINDCIDHDVGILDWFYDGKAHYIREILTHIHSYLQWLKSCGKPGCYIYFGESALPECFDLDGCCRLLNGLGMILSDDGKDDFDTAAGFEESITQRRCAFCHKVVESGRYALFDHHRYICMECFDVVHEQSRLDKLLRETHRSLCAAYPEIAFGRLSAAFDGVHDLRGDQALSEYSGRMDFDGRTVYVERDIPQNNARIVLMRGIIAMWQHDNGLMIPAAEGQLYYEELRYLRETGCGEAADWILAAMDGWKRGIVEDIAEQIKLHMPEQPAEPEKTGDGVIDDGEDDPSVPIATLPEDDDTGEDAEKSSAEDETPAEGESEATDKDAPEAPEVPDPGTRYTSFTYLLEKVAEMARAEDEEPIDDSDDDDNRYSDKLYDPNKMPRFWKDYLRGKKATEQEDELSSDDRDQLDDDELDELGRGNGDVVPRKGVDDRECDLGEFNAPPPLGDEADEASDGAPDEAEKADEVPGEASDEVSDEAEKADEVPGKDADDGEKPARRGLFGLFKRKKGKKSKKDKNKSKDTDDGAEKASPSDEEDVPTPPEGDESAEKSEKSAKKDKKDKVKKDKKAKKDKKKRAAARKPRRSKKTNDDEEKDNPLIRLYNDMLRHIYAFSDEYFSREGISDDDINRVFYYVLYDWPEIFWTAGCEWNAENVRMKYRCLGSDGKVDKRQVAEKLKAIKRGAREFTRGITRRTKPYDACLKIYRRLILTLDYDGVGLSAGVSNDLRRDDRLRSLYGALVDHRVVCAGYAIAMQYLLQSVGICCGTVLSEGRNGVGHAFNALRLGKNCYYMDPTWGDSSNTMTGDKNKDIITYDYFCVPYRELIMTDPASRYNHEPNRKVYPDLEEFKSTRHEYFRYHGAFLDRYDEEEIIELIIRQAQEYDPDTMGAFGISMRFPDIATRDYVALRLTKGGQFFVLLGKARERIPKKKKACMLLNATSMSGIQPSNVPTLYLFLS